MLDHNSYCANAQQKRLQKQYQTQQKGERDSWGSESKAQARVSSINGKIKNEYEAYLAWSELVERVEDHFNCTSNAVRRNA